MVIRSTLLLLACAVVIGGCSIPSDPYKTLERVRGDEMRVGMTESSPWAEERDGRPIGVEVELAREFARSLGARTKWSRGSEEELVEALREGELDLLIGGLTGRSPWKKEVAFTRPYATVLGEHGEPEKHVMAVRLGENAFLTELDVFLQGREGEIAGRLEAAGELVMGP